MSEASSLWAEEELRTELRREYSLRFGDQREYRNAVWKILIAKVFQVLIPLDSTVLDLGCGWGEFINNVRAKKKYAMDLNPEAKEHLTNEVQVIEQDCSRPWPLLSESLDCVFSSNFFEHLPGKNELRRTLLQAHRCLKPGGRVICLGPNIRYLPGAYWDFWDHCLPLTERSLAEALKLTGFEIEHLLGKFLPYRMTGRRPMPLSLVQLYLKLPWAWQFFGKQFLVIASK